MTGGYVFTRVPESGLGTGLPLPLPRPPRQDTPQTGYTAGSTPLAVTQENFLVAKKHLMEISVFEKSLMDISSDTDINAHVT